MNNIKIVNKLNNEILKSIIKKGDENFANGYFTKEYLMTYLNDADSFVLVYQNHEKVVGFSIATIWNSDDLFTNIEGFYSTLTENGITNKFLSQKKRKSLSM